MAKPAISGRRADWDKFNQIDETSCPMLGIREKTNPIDVTHCVGIPSLRVKTRCKPAATGIAIIL